MGNPWRSDDAVGLHVARRLRAEVPGAVEVLEREGEPAGLFESWEGADALVVVDAVSSGSPPGSVHRFDASDEPLPVELFGASTHALGLGEAVELARALGRLPRRVVVYGIEGASFEAGEELSPAVEAAIDRVVAEIGEEVRRCTSAC